MNRLSAAAAATLIDGLVPPSEVWRDRALRRFDTLTKPLGSLGRLEELAAQIVAIRAAEPISPLTKSVYIFAADHGVVEEGVSAYPSAVTAQMVWNFLSGGAAVNVLANLHGADLHIVDVGVDADFPAAGGLLHRKVARGTRNILREEAMSDEEVATALKIGGQLASEAAIAGCSLLAIGEMGIGNTTSASAITCAISGASPAVATGRGTGIDHDAHLHKIAIIEQILQRHHGEMATPLDVLRCVGGLEIAAMVGMMLAAARHRIVVVLDGFISTAAAVLAVAIEPLVSGYLISGHQSQEPGHKLLLEHLRLMPLLTLDMRLGEASGAVLAMPIIDSAVALYLRMATFADAGVSQASA